MNFAHLLDQAATIGAAAASAIAGIIVVTAPAIRVIAPIVIPPLREALINAIPNAKLRSAADAVSSIGLIISGQVAGMVWDLLARAQSADSDGGKEVTPKEWGEITAKGVALGIQLAKDHGLFEKALSAYGGEEQLRQALRGIVQGAMHKALEKGSGFVGTADGTGRGASNLA